MIGPMTFVIVIIVVAASLSALFILRPGITLTKGGKILAFVSLFILPFISLAMGTSQHMERAESTAFCLSCHVMDAYGKSLHVDDPSFLPAAHYQNNRVPRDQACYTCHTDYAMFGTLSAKLRGLKHVYVQLLGKVPEKPALYTPYNNRECLHCHGGARNFEEGATHTAEPDRIAKIKSNELSCLSSGCHESVHNIAGLKDAQFWSEVKANGESN